MTPYFAVLGLSIALVTAGTYLAALRRQDALVAGHGGARTGWNPFYLLSLVPLVAMGGLRYATGTDYGTYRVIFNRVNPYDWGYTLATAMQEPGFVLLQLAIKTFTDEPAVFFTICSILTVVPSWFAIRRIMGDRVVLSWVLWIGLAFYLSSFNMVRQSMAMAFLMLAITYLPRRRWVYVVLSLVAASFHITALLAAVILYLTQRWKPTMKQVVMVVLGAGVLALGGLTFLAPLVSILNSRYGAYILEGSETGLGAWLQLAVTAALALYAFWVSRGSQDPEVTRYAMWVLLGIGFMIVGTQAVVLFRMSAYFKLFLVVLVPLCLAQRPRSSLHNIGLGAMTLAYYAAHILTYDDLMPYHSII